MFDDFADVGLKVLDIDLLFFAFCPSGDGGSLGIDDTFLIGIFLDGLGNLLEELIESTENLGLIELKVYCFDGEPQIIARQAGSVSGKSNSYYDSNWQWIEVSFHEEGVYWSKTPPSPPPKNLEKLLEIAGGLSKETDFVRVDFFEDQMGSLKVGELTSYEVAGKMEYSPEDFSLFLGKHWTPNYRIESKPLSFVRHLRSFSG